jgi:aminoglycoside phosphotransferase (APT) family kinase protein
LENVSNKQLVDLYLTGPVLFGYGGNKLVRLSHTLVLKGGEDVLSCEAENMKFAATHTQIQIPKVHRVFPFRLYDYDTWFIVMDYISGYTVGDNWKALNKRTRNKVASQVASMIEQMQSITLNHMPPGPIGGGAPFRGAWFSDYGAGPFDTLQELEDWLNHKLDICLRFKQAPEDTPRFEFKDIVLTHQDIAPRNLILDPSGRLWLIDWAYAGVYPKGFEQATIPKQAGNEQFSELVLSKLSSSYPKETLQLFNIQYGLTTATLL